LGGGRNAKKIAKFQNIIWSRRGIFRNISTYTNENFEASQFDDDLITPIMKPINVAATIPKMATNSVFKTPI